MKVIEVVANQYLRILALEETLGQKEVEISILKERIIQLTPSTESSQQASTATADVSAERSSTIQTPSGLGSAVAGETEAARSAESA